MRNHSVPLLLLLCGAYTVNVSAMQPWKGQPAAPKSEARGFSGWTPWQKATAICGGVAGAVGALWGTLVLANRLRDNPHVRGAFSTVGRGYMSVTRPVRREIVRAAQWAPRTVTVVGDCLKVAAITAVLPRVTRAFEGSGVADYFSEIGKYLGRRLAWHAAEVAGGNIEVPQAVSHDPEDAEQLVGPIPEEVEAVMALAEDPVEFERMQATEPQSMLFYGPSGTGKTKTTRYLAKNSHIPFIYVDITSVVDCYVGNSAKNLKAYFDDAIRRANAEEARFAVLFFDEIDALGKKRSAMGDGGAGQENLRLVREFLTQLDGFKQNSKFLVIGATNFNLDDLDPAFVQRFSHHVYFPLPTPALRLELLQTFMAGKGYRQADDEAALLNDVGALHDICQRIAGRMEGFSHREIAHFVQNVAHESVMAKREKIKRLRELVRLRAAFEAAEGDALEQTRLQAIIDGARYADALRALVRALPVERIRELVQQLPEERTGQVSAVTRRLLEPILPAWQQQSFITEALLMSNLEKMLRARQAPDREEEGAHDERVFARVGGLPIGLGNLFRRVPGLRQLVRPPQPFPAELHPVVAPVEEGGHFYDDDEAAHC